MLSHAYSFETILPFATKAGKKKVEDYHKEVKIIPLCRILRQGQNTYEFFDKVSIRFPVNPHVFMGFFYTG